MHVQVFIEAYRVGGLDALNVAINGLTDVERHSVVKKLEGIAYTLRWRSLGRRFGYIWSGPKSEP